MFKGIRCQGDDSGCQHCLNPRCECKNHKRDKTREARMKEQRNRHNSKRTRRGVYHMDDPEAGDTYEFSAI